MIRFGLCCLFKEQPINFKRTTVKYLSKFSLEEQQRRLSAICLYNAESLLKALDFCYQNKIGCFRINSQILPLKTHHDIGYSIYDLPEGEKIAGIFKDCGLFCKRHGIRTTFHPDQFIILSSPNPDVVSRSIADLEYQAEVAEWVNSDVINIHAGGVYGDKESALNRLRNTIDTLSDRVRRRLTIENDDKSYSPEDLLPLCSDMEIPFVYDIHHHRCLRDSLTVEQATERCFDTWNREPLFHLSSPKNGWKAQNQGIITKNIPINDIRMHHDYIDINDFPKFWLSINRDMTVEVEAKAKEVAILKLMKELEFI
ncbi:MAG: UV DNA damage repair endonuclease UvsE [Desulfamplus sp.]|nr:UV DNA damage repair endonuclease UvsE [Desulfamplus sp.]